MVMIIEQRIHLKPLPPPATALALVFTIMKQQTHAQSKQSHTSFQGAQFKLSKKNNNKETMYFVGNFTHKPCVSCKICNVIYNRLLSSFNSFLQFTKDPGLRLKAVDVVCP